MTAFEEWKADFLAREPNRVTPVDPETCFDGKDEQFLRSISVSLSVNNPAANPAATWHGERRCGMFDTSD